MYKVGFIGYGSMGSMLIDGFLSSGSLKPDELIVSTRRSETLDVLTRNWPSISIAQDNSRAASAQYVFLCVKPRDIKTVLEEIKPSLHHGCNIISLAGPVKMKRIAAFSGCAVTKVTPSLPSVVGKGVTLICHSDGVSPEDSVFIDNLFSTIGMVKHLPEPDFELAAELTSCMPGLLAAFMQEMALSATRHTATLPMEDITDMLNNTLNGTAALLIEYEMHYEQIVQRVATKGGITEEGVKVLRAGLPNLFDELFEKMLVKRKFVDAEIDKEFSLRD